MGLNDLRDDLIENVQNKLKNSRPDHPWINLTKHDFLVRSGLWTRDLRTQKEGYTLAAALLFGSDLTIQRVLPFYRIDALVRIKNIDRYDDRDIIETNLFDSYSRLMQFINKHLPDPFYLENGIRLSVRDTIFREVVSNLIVHRDYSNLAYTSLVIYPDKVITTNPNKASFIGEVLPKNFTPFTKNPVITKIFRELGYVDSLGSEVININKYYKALANNVKSPQFIEDSNFKTIIYLGDLIIKDNSTLQEDLKEGSDKSSDKIINLIKNNPSITSLAISEELNISTKAVEKQISILRKQGIIERVGSKKAGYWKLNV